MCAAPGTKQDSIEIEILADGTLKFTTPKISGANHQSADAFLKGTQDLLGGETDIRKRSDVAKPTVETIVKQGH